MEGEGKQFAYGIQRHGAFITHFWDTHRSHYFRHTCGVLFHKHFLALATHVLQKSDWLQGSDITSSLGDGPEAMHSFRVSQMGTHFCFFVWVNIALPPSFSFIRSRILLRSLG